MEYVTLNNGIKMPLEGFGVFQVPDPAQCKQAVLDAINSGYRLIDTAAAYMNEEAVGAAIKESGVDRSELFITTKLWVQDATYEGAKQAIDTSLAKLGLDYLDLYLIHWPLPESGYKEWKQLDKETWRAMEDLYQEGRIRAIGLSNFLPHHIENILEDCTVRPAVDQIEYHPGYSQEAAVQYCKERDILVQAWSPIGRQRVLTEPLVQELAKKYGVSPARICLKFAVQRGIIPLPKSSSMERMKENLDLYSFELEQEDIWRLATMPQAGWSGEHPDRERVTI